MARNDPQHPELARAAQDVDAPIHRDHEGPHHFGRGGAANIRKPTEEEARIARETNERKSGDAVREQGPAGDVKGLLEKGKEFLGKLGKK